MTTQEFEAQLKEIDPKFEIVQHPRSPDLAGVYYDRNVENKTGFVVTVPSGEIRENMDPSYADTLGHPHNYSTRVMAIVRDHLNRLETDPSYKEAFYAPIDDMTAKALRQ